MKRRLAAVLAADLVGYARLMRKDEAGTLERFTDILRKVLEPLIEEHIGRIVKLVGDGLLVEFSSAVSAVACALSWQDCVETHEEAERVVRDRLQFRIGINLGDVIVQADDIHGDGEYSVFLQE
jgi:adenylate cyclase